MDRLIGEIIEGKSDGESASDVLTLCYLAALVVSAVEAAEAGRDDPESMPPPDDRDRDFARRLERIGKILCPLADDVKHDKAAYRDGMTAARLDYSGVAISDALQGAWRGAIRALAEERLLVSVEIAVEQDVYRALRIKQQMMGA